MADIHDIIGNSNGDETHELEKHLKKTHCRDINSFQYNNPAANTALMRTAYSRRVQQFECLLKHGADIRVRNTKGWTAFEAAILGFSPSIVARLIALGEDVNRKGQDGRAVLGVAFCQPDHTITRLLLEAGANPNVYIEYCGIGDTPINIAIESNDSALICLLLDKGAIPHFISHSSRVLITSKDHSCRSKYMSALEVFNSECSDPNSSVHCRNDSCKKCNFRQRLEEQAKNAGHVTFLWK